MLVETAVIGAQVLSGQRNAPVILLAIISLIVFLRANVWCVLHSQSIYPGPIHYCVKRTAASTFLPGPFVYLEKNR